MVGDGQGLEAQAVSQLYQISGEYEPSEAVCECVSRSYHYHKEFNQFDPAEVEPNRSSRLFMRFQGPRKDFLSLVGSYHQK
jgi:hypothetical protein